MHAGQRPDPNTGARAVPIFQTTSYVFEDPESAAAYFNLQEYGNTYSRIMNPTVAVFEERMASLEGGCGAVAFASGIAAQAAALFTLLQPGDHVVSSSALYGGTVNQFKHLLRKMNVELTWVDPDDPDAWRAAVRENTKVFYGETIGNPGGNVLDIEALAAIAHEHEAAADRRQHVRDAVSVPADRVGRRHRASTRRRSSSAATAPASAASSSTRARSTGRTAASRSMAEPSPAYHGLQFHETFGMYGYLMKLRAETLRDLGAAMSPFNAFLFLQGLETLSLRMERHVENAAAVAALPRRRTRWRRTSPIPACRRAAIGRWSTNICRAAPGPSSRSTAAAAARRAGLHPRRHAVVAPGERRRLEEPDHPSGQHHPPPA